jgi:hypothetical protein
MKKHIIVAGAAVLALGFSASLASAQCNYEHPKQAKQIKAALTQAFVSCLNPGGNTPNTTTEGGVPSCAPPMTFHEQSGSPGGGWLWDELKGKGDVSFKAAKNKAVHILNPPNDTADLAVQLKMSGILNTLSAPAGGNGTLATVARATLEDRTGGPMTVVDFPAGFPITAIGGKVQLKTTANALLNGIGQPGLPGCTNIELVNVTVVDPQSDNFAAIGTFLPNLDIP